MKNNILMLCFLLVGTFTLQGQGKIVTKTGAASFYSKAPLEDIEAHNQHVVAILDLSNKEVAVKMLIKQFEFENSLMQEHFNENYLESDQFPSAVFTGKIIYDNEIILSKPGTHEIQINGSIEIHGVKKTLETAARLTTGNGKISAKTNFKLKTADFDIEIPSLVIKNIAEVIDVELSFDFASPNN